MLLTISTDHQPATDLGYLLHKNPGGHHTAEFGFGVGHVLFPEASEERCTAALVVDIDPVGLVRGRPGSKGNDFSLAQYVNDRPYVTSSFTSVVLGKMFSTAMTGRSKERPELAAEAINLEVRLPVTPCRGGVDVATRLFEPLGYTVIAEEIPLDPKFPEWGMSRYLDLTLSTTATLKSVLEQLFVLLPVLDDDKHYWVGADEIDKLLRRGGDWLAGHPERDLITRRYLRHDRETDRGGAGASDGGRPHRPRRGPGRATTPRRRRSRSRSASTSSAPMPWSPRCGPAGRAGSSTWDAGQATSCGSC